MSQNTHQNAEPFSKTTRGRKSRIISKKLDFTGRDPVMVVVKDLQEATINYKEDVNFVNSVHKTVLYNSVGKEEFTRMVRFETNNSHVVRTILSLILI